MARPKGYAGNILRVDLSTRAVSTIPTREYAGRFLGGRGVALIIHWNEVPAAAHALDPENRLVFMTGPICGVPGFASSRWQVSGKSPVRGLWSHGNLGGAWGVHLKRAGYDGLILQGKAEKPSYLLIRDDGIELRDASLLKGRGAIETRKALNKELGRGFRIVAIGPAGESQVRFATLLADSDSSGSGGLGAVMGSKNLKAIAVRGSGRVEIADERKLRRLRKRFRQLRGAPAPTPIPLSTGRIKKDVCMGCGDGCSRVTYEAADGTAGKTMCHSGIFYQTRAQRYYGEANEVPFRATKLCDDYGVDTYGVDMAIKWLSRCFQAGLISDKDAGLPIGSIGSLEFIETLVRKISHREGIGELLAEGVHRAARGLGRDYEEMITDYASASNEMAVYGPRLYLTTGLLWAMDPRMPIQQLHEVSVPLMMWAARAAGGSGDENYMTSEVVRKMAETFWGGTIAADFSTYEGKALAAVKIQNRQMAKECMILCDFAWPVLHSAATPDHVGDPTLESQILEAVTGNPVGEEGLSEIGSRVFNLQRAVLAREGMGGRAGDTLEAFHFTVGLKGDFGNPQCLVPGRDGETFCRKGMVLDRGAFEKMKDEYYGIRGWDPASGLQTAETLRKLELVDVAEGLAREGLVV